MRNKFLRTGQGGFNPIQKLRVFYSGLRYAVLNESSVAIEIILSLLVLTACFYYRQWLDFTIVLVASGLMLVAEMVNTAIEALCDFVESGHNEKNRHYQGCRLCRRGNQHPGLERHLDYGNCPLVARDSVSSNPSSTPGASGG